MNLTSSIKSALVSVVFALSSLKQKFNFVVQLGNCWETANQIQVLSFISIARTLEAAVMNKTLI